MTGDELRRRVERLGLTYREAAAALGLSLAGLNHQMRGIRSVSRQTAMLLERIEADRAPAVRPAKAGPPPRQRRVSPAGR